MLPLTLEEHGRASVDAAWRTGPEASPELRVRFLLASLLAKFDLRDLHELLIVCPDRETARVARIVGSVLRDRRVRVLPETMVCADVERAVDPDTGLARGWYVQQMLKLAAAQIVATPHYVTLDSDIVAVRPFGAADLIESGRAVCGVEDARTYEQLYTPEFARIEVGIKQGRVDASSALLAGERGTQYAGRFYSETPTVFDTQAIRDLCGHLTSVHGRQWSAVLAEETGWTEQYLYFRYLEMTGRLEQVCVLAGPNRVLHLAGSVWHPSAHYNHPRPYDRAHFADTVLSGPEGVFVAIQTWPPLDSWLPQAGCGSLDEFYVRLADVLDIRSLGRLGLRERLGRILKSRS